MEEGVDEWARMGEGTGEEATFDASPHQIEGQERKQRTRTRRRRRRKSRKKKGNKSDQQQLGRSESYSSTSSSSQRVEPAAAAGKATTAVKVEDGDEAQVLDKQEAERRRSEDTEAMLVLEDGGDGKHAHEQHDIPAKRAKHAKHAKHGTPEARETQLLADNHESGEEASAMPLASVKPFKKVRVLPPSLQNPLAGPTTTGSTQYNPAAAATHASAMSTTASQLSVSQQRLIENKRLEALRRRRQAQRQRCREQAAKVLAASGLVSPTSSLAAAPSSHSPHPHHHHTHHSAAQSIAASPTATEATAQQDTATAGGTANAPNNADLWVISPTSSPKRSSAGRAAFDGAAGASTGQAGTAAEATTATAAGTSATSPDHGVAQWSYSTHVHGGGGSGHQRHGPDGEPWWTRQEEVRQLQPQVYDPDAPTPPHGSPIKSSAKDGLLSPPSWISAKALLSQSQQQTAGSSDHNSNSCGSSPAAKLPSSSTLSPFQSPSQRAHAGGEENGNSSGRAEGREGQHASCAAAATTAPQTSTSKISAQNQQHYKRRQQQNKQQQQQPASGGGVNLKAMLNARVIDPKVEVPIDLVRRGPDEPHLAREQRAAIDAAAAGSNIFLTGAAGVGKSFTLQQIITRLNRYKRKVYVTATTGLAAINLESQATTIHSFSGIRLGHEPAKMIADRISELTRKNQPGWRWRKCDVLVIDEISMLSAEVFSKLDYVARTLRKRLDLPFGGLQLIVCGDFFQLPPVPDLTPCPNCGNRNANNRRFAKEKGPNMVQCKSTVSDVMCGCVFDPTTRYAFERDPLGKNVWKECNFQVHHLIKVFRQSDKTFVSALHKIRWGCIDEDVEDVLNAARRPLSLADGILPTRLYGQNREVDAENLHRFRQISNPAFNFESYDYCNHSGRFLLEQLKRDCQAKALVSLKVGAQVMLLRNLDTAAGLCNGSRGVVVDFITIDRQHDFREFQGHAGDAPLSVIHAWMDKNERLPIVIFENNALRTIYPSMYSRQLDREMAGRYQLPLRLAWAMTIHKCQGMSLDKVEISLDHSFASGQAYVALSRARSLTGLQLTSFDKSVIAADSTVLAFYNNIGCTYATTTAARNDDDDDDDEGDVGMVRKMDNGAVTVVIDGRELKSPQQRLEQQGSKSSTARATTDANSKHIDDGGDAAGDDADDDLFALIDDAVDGNSINASSRAGGANSNKGVTSSGVKAEVDNDVIPIDEAPSPTDATTTSKSHVNTSAVSDLLRRAASTFLASNGIEQRGSTSRRRSSRSLKAEFAELAKTALVDAMGYS